MMAKPVEIEVAGGCCCIRFTPGVSTGPCGSDTSPGVGFDLISDRPTLQSGGKYYHGIGVISRTDATRLRDALEIFLKNHIGGLES